jgi:4-hydroxybenzoate polyprenyltransferase
VARHRVPRTRLRRVVCLILLVTAALVLWGAAFSVAERCEDYSDRMIVDGQSTPVTRC